MEIEKVLIVDNDEPTMARSLASAIALGLAARRNDAPMIEPVVDVEDPTLPADSFTRWKPGIEIRPGEMWPDGKVRPHKIKTPAGETLWLTADEYDSLVLAERHRRRANPIGASSRPKPHLKVGELVTPAYPEDETKDGWPDFAVRSIKADGRVILESLHDDLGDLHRGAVLRFGEHEYDVLRSSGRSATIRLRPAAA